MTNAAIAKRQARLDAAKRVNDLIENTARAEGLDHADDIDEFRTAVLELLNEEDD